MQKGGSPDPEDANLTRSVALPLEQSYQLCLANQRYVFMEGPRG